MESEFDGSHFSDKHPLVFEQSYFNDEIWLPTYEEAHVGVRVLLMKGFNVNATTRYSDYKRFNVQTLSTINQPKSATPTDPAKPNPNGPTPEKPNN
jgi:hypothetical protein